MSVIGSHSLIQKLSIGYIALYIYEDEMNFLKFPIFFLFVEDQYATHLISFVASWIGTKALFAIAKL